jgi:sulfate adenylyltransferase subunit 2
VDTGHNFPEVIEYRDQQVAKLDVRLVVGSVQEDIDRGSIVEQPVPGATRNRLQTFTLLRVLEENRYDAVFGGGRRDEEKARAKERVFSLRDEFGQWDPRAQRPELWQLYNTRHRPGEHFRVFPLSNWTELDIWQYVDEQKLELPQIYFAHRRAVFRRSGMLLAVGPWTKPREGIESELAFETSVRYRTVGDMTCTAAVESTASTPAEIIMETAATRVSERGATRADDRFSDAAMEDRKREGYF